MSDEKIYKCDTCGKRLSEEECLKRWDIGPEREPRVVEVEDKSYRVDKQDICNEPLAVHLRTGTKRRR